MKKGFAAAAIAATVGLTGASASGQTVGFTVGNYFFAEADLATSLTISGNVGKFQAPSLTTELGISLANSFSPRVDDVNFNAAAGGFFDRNVHVTAFALGVDSSFQNAGIGTLNLSFPTFNVAANSVFVVYESGGGDEGNNIEVSFDNGSTWFDGNTDASFVQVGTFGEVTFDLSSFANQDLTNVQIRNTLTNGQHTGANDPDIAFAGFATVIPLPGAAGMAMAGMGMIGLRRRR